jgi:hypothetical protein
MAKLPWLWLEGEEDEQIAKADRGCKLIRDYLDSGDPAFFMCARHQRAFRLLNKLEEQKKS